MFRDIKLLVISRFRKIVFFAAKLLIKRERQKIKKILQSVLEKIISQIILQNFCEIRLNPKEMELLE